MGLEKIDEFQKAHPDARKRLESWLNSVKANSFSHFVGIKAQYPQADYAHPYVIFNLGRKLRLVSRVDYELQQVLVIEVFTHPEYDRWNKKRS